MQEKSSSLTMVLIHVDNMKITGNKDKAIQDLKLFLQKQFHIKKHGNLKYFLDLEVARSKVEIIISQPKYTLEIIDDVGFLEAQLVDFPMEQNLRITNNQGELLNDASRYIILVG